MSVFRMDTRGVVHALPPGGDHDEPYAFRWEDFTPFEQGALRAMCGEGAWLGDSVTRVRVDYQDLAPATVQWVLWACRGYLKGLPASRAYDEAGGGVFWRNRLGGCCGPAPMALRREGQHVYLRVQG
ncbi:MAG: hypothetical protein U1C74_32730 [Phenylobacterium sp.]|nr:hypothetical protein [Phenylobacterium sp.]